MLRQGAGEGTGLQERKSAEGVHGRLPGGGSLLDCICRDECMSQDLLLCKRQNPTQLAQRNDGIY